MFLERVTLQRFNTVKDQRKGSAQQNQFTMATPDTQPKSEITVPVTEHEQTIDPWSVDAGQDSEGNALAFDYLAIAK